MKTDTFCWEYREIKTSVQGVFIQWFLRDYLAYNYNFNIFKRNTLQTSYNYQQYKHVILYYMEMGKFYNGT